MHVQQLLILVISIFLLFSCQTEKPKAETAPTENQKELTQEIKNTPQKPIPQKLDSIKKDSQATKVTKAEKPSLSPPEMKFDSMTYNYGVIYTGDIITHEFKFVNAGDRPLEINNVIGSCGCTAASFNFLPYPKGDSGIIKAQFDSKGKIGKQESTLTIKSNHKNGDLVLTIKGIVKAPPKEEEN